MSQPRKFGPSVTPARRTIEEARQIFTSGRVAEAEAMLEGLLARNPREIEAILALGIVANETGRLDDAISRMNQALAVDPRCVPALWWLSNLHLQRGLPLDAQAFAERAVSLDPQNPAIQAALGRSFLHQGRAAEAIPFLQRSAEIDPNNAIVQYELADALQGAGRWAPAMDALRRAVRLSPDPNWLVRLAYLELRLGQISDAERYARRALTREPNNLGAQVIMARVHTERSQLPEAEESWARAEKLNPAPGFLNLERALAFTAVGRFGEALEQLEQSLEANPRQGLAYQALVYSKRITDEDLPLVRRMEQVTNAGDLPPSEQVNILFALGKAYDNLGDLATAMDYFDRANAMHRSLTGGQPLDRASYRERVDRKIRTFTPALFADPRLPRNESSLPVLVVGMMRSGTSLTEQLLTCHPEIGGAGEQGYWAFHEDEMVDFARAVVRPSIVRHCADEYLELLTSLAPGYPHVVDKNPANLYVLGSFHLAFPNARILHIRRNPIDTALSIWTTPMVTTADFVNDRENIVFAYREYERMMAHWRTVLPGDRFLEVAYEDIVEHPEIHVRRMVEFLELPWDEACLHHEKNQRRVRTPSFWQVRQPLFRTSTRRWERYRPWLGAFAKLDDGNRDKSEINPEVRER